MSQVRPPAQPARLLVVEDDDTIRETVCEAMEMEGFQVTAATNGQSAWDLDRKSTRLNSSHVSESRMPSSA